MGFAEGFAAGWGMVDTMMARKHQQEMDARSMAIQEAAAQRAAELFPLQKQQAEGTIAGQTLQNAAAQQTIDYNTDTRGLRIDALKGANTGQNLQNTATQQTIDYNTDTAGLRVDALKGANTGQNLQNAAAQQTVDYNNETHDSRVKAANLAVSTAEQQLLTAKQAYAQADQTNPVALKTQQTALEDAQLKLQMAQREQALVTTLTGVGGASAPLTVDALAKDPARIAAVRPAINDYLTKTGATGNRLELSRIIPYGDGGKYIVAVNSYAPDGTLIAKDRPITARRTAEGDDAVRFFTKDELNAELAAAQTPAKSPGTAAPAATAKSLKVSEDGFTAYAPTVLKEADRVYAEKDLAALGVKPEEWRRAVLGMTAQESRFNKTAVSGKGASGLLQVMPRTAQDPGYGVAPLKDGSPEENIRFGADYLAAMLKETNGNITNALAAYNGGLGNVQKHGGPIPGNAENQAYPRLVQQLGNSDLYDRAVALSGGPAPAAAPASGPAAAPTPTSPVGATPGLASASTAPAVSTPSSAISKDATQDGGVVNWVRDRVRAIGPSPLSTAQETVEKLAKNRAPDEPAFRAVARTGLADLVTVTPDAVRAERKAPSADMGAKYWTERPLLQKAMGKADIARLDEHYSAFKPAPAKPATPSVGFTNASPVAPAVPAETAQPVSTPSGLSAARSLTPEQVAAARGLQWSTNPRYAALADRVLGEGKDAADMEVTRDGDNFAVFNKKTGQVINRGTISGGATDGKKVTSEELKTRSAKVDLLMKQNPAAFESTYTDDKGRVHSEKSPETAQRFMTMLNTTLADYPKLDVTSPTVQPVIYRAFQTAQAIEKKDGHQIFESLTPIIAMYHAGISEADPKELETIVATARGLTEQNPSMSLSEAMNRTIAPRHPIAGVLLQDNPKLDPSVAMQIAMQIDSAARQAIEDGDTRSQVDLISEMTRKASKQMQPQ